MAVTGLSGQLRLSTHANVRLRATLTLMPTMGGGGGGGRTAAGAALFLQNCSGCHGTDAHGLGGRPDIRCTASSRIYNAMRTGRGNGLMPVFAASAVPDAQVEQIVSYLGSLCDGTPAGNFRSNCVTCHSATAGGGVNANGVHGPNIRCTGTNDFLEKVQVGSDAMPPFREFTTTDIEAIASYVQQDFCPLGD